MMHSVSASLSVEWRSGETHEVKKSVNFSLSLSSKVGSLDTVHDPSSNFLGIPNLLQEASVFLDTLDTESLVLSSDSVDEVIVGEFSSSNVALDLGVICGCTTRLISNALGFGIADLFETHRGIERSSSQGQLRILLPRTPQSFASCVG